MSVAYYCEAAFLYGKEKDLPIYCHFTAYFQLVCFPSSQHQMEQCVLRPNSSIYGSVPSKIKKGRADFVRLSQLGGARGKIDNVFAKEGNSTAVHL